MNLKNTAHNTKVIFLLALGIRSFAAMAGLHVSAHVDSDMRLSGDTDFHITATSADEAIAPGKTIDLADDNCRLFFDNIRPSDVIRHLIGSVRVKGEILEPDANARIYVYRHGTEILPHSTDYSPLTAYSQTAFDGESESFITGPHYSNSPASDVDAGNIRPLTLDDNISSFRLARGYMATLATNPDGTGYSRCFIAENTDLSIERLPAELCGKVSFVRVFPWRVTSKKGWVGGNGQSNPPEGFLEQQADATSSTWVYNWGTSADWGRSPQTQGSAWRNQEFVPEKWGHGGDSDWHKIANTADYTHLLSYNEPDHSEQSAVSVEKAVAEWPRHLHSGLRLGSPATTDFSWLYRFIDECDARNYRVDYVAIHAYWGGSGSAVQVSSVKDWYKKLKEVHEKTGRPIWITEWNNGANWTHESWPADKSAQQEKQRKFMEEVLQMMDTCSFIERYSVYNWVEEKRSLFWGNLNLTPAGKVYRDFKAGKAFSPEKEVIPTWTINSAPDLDISYAGQSRFTLRWIDGNIEQTDGYIIERSNDGNTFSTVAQVPFRTDSWSEPEAVGDAGDVDYRVVSIAEGERAYTSNSTGYSILPASGKEWIAGRRTTAKELRFHLLHDDRSYGSAVILPGIQTYRMKAPMAASARLVSPGLCALGTSSWHYNESDSFVSRDTLAYIIFTAPGNYSLGGLDAIAGKIDNLDSGKRMSVKFPSSFSCIPAVFASVVSDSGNYPAVASVSSVSREGFDVEIRYESATPDNERRAGAIDYVAITPGSALLPDGREIKAGICRNANIGYLSSAALPIEYGSVMTDCAFFAATQSEEKPDAPASSIRAISISGSRALIFKDFEKSMGAALPESHPEDIAWCAISSGKSAATENLPAAVSSGIFYDTAAKTLYSCGNESTEKLSVFDSAGKCIASNCKNNSISTRGFTPGTYVARCGSSVLKISVK